MSWALIAAVVLVLVLLAGVIVKALLLWITLD